MVETDEVHEALGGTVRTAATVAAQIAERAAYSVQRQAAERARESEQQARALQERVEVSRTAARASYADTGRPEWWDTAQPARIADAYDAARAWSGIDPQAKTAREAIEWEVRTRYGIDADTLAREAIAATAAPLQQHRRKPGDVVAATAVIEASEAAASAEGATQGWQAAATEERRLAHTLAATEQTPPARVAAATADQDAGVAASAVRAAATARQTVNHDADTPFTRGEASGSGSGQVQLSTPFIQRAQAAENGAERAVAAERFDSSSRIDTITDAMRAAGGSEQAVQARRVAAFGQAEPAAAALTSPIRSTTAAAARPASEELRRSLAR